MGQNERKAVAAATRRTDVNQRESDHQRWADDGGFSPEPEAARPAPAITVVIRNSWAAIRIVVGIGFALGWLTARVSCRESGTKLLVVGR